MIPYHHGVDLSKETGSEFLTIDGTHGFPIFTYEFKNYLHQKINKTNKSYANELWKNFNKHYDLK